MLHERFGRGVEIALLQHGSARHQGRRYARIVSPHQTDRYHPVVGRGAGRVAVVDERAEYPAGRAVGPRFTHRHVDLQQAQTRHVAAVGQGIAVDVGLPRFRVVEERNLLGPGLVGRFREEQLDTDSAVGKTGRTRVRGVWVLPDLADGVTTGRN